MRNSCLNMYIEQSQIAPSENIIYKERYRNQRPKSMSRYGILNNYGDAISPCLDIVPPLLSSSPTLTRSRVPLAAGFRQRVLLSWDLRIRNLVTLNDANLDYFQHRLGTRKLYPNFELRNKQVTIKGSDETLEN